ncbi:DUF6660 family protein [Reichenbachiella ulvae]|uniref:DUF6660 family protein n=1 Tax=Reichenbachiella ulvae TaxID=2980104 RepID=UPI0038504464
MTTCSDQVASEQEVAITEHAADEGHSHGESDDCSPFCICHCCHSHTVFHSIHYSTGIGLEPIVELQSNYRTLLSDLRVNAIWHPPQYS